MTTQETITLINEARAEMRKARDTVQQIFEHSEDVDIQTDMSFVRDDLNECIITLRGIYAHLTGRK